MGHVLVPRARKAYKARYHGEFFPQGDVPCLLLLHPRLPLHQSLPIQT